MDTLHSLAALAEHFDTTPITGSCRSHFEKPARSLKAYGDNLVIGSIIDVDARKCIHGYNKKDSDFRPALVTALWRDKGGGIKKIEVASITTQTGRIYPDKFPIDTPEKIRDFGRNKSAIIDMNVTTIADNTTEFFPRTNRKVNVIPAKYWPDIALRRADAILQNGELQLNLQGSIAGLVREGIFFPEIKEKHVWGHAFVPEIGEARVARKEWAEVPQFRVNALARFAAYYVSTHPKTLAQTHQFPPIEAIPDHFPHIPFKTHNKARGYAAPLLAAE